MREYQAINLGLVRDVWLFAAHLSSHEDAFDEQVSDIDQPVPTPGVGCTWNYNRCRAF